MKRAKEYYERWAVACGDDCDGFIGFGWVDPSSMAMTHASMRVCLFTSRLEARSLSHKVRRSFPKARAVKVKIQITEIP